MRTLTTRSGAPVSRLGLAAYPRQSPACVRAAFAAGVNLFFFYGPSHLGAFADLPALVSEAGPRILVATGSGSRRRAGLERARRTLATRLGAEVIDVFFAEYLNPGDTEAAVFGPEGVLDTLRRWRDEGQVRYVGATTHDAGLGARLVADGRVDVIMLRYNMAHRRVARAVFPPAAAAGVPVVAFTATRWGTLLAGHPAWSAPPPAAADCYRYCLHRPPVTTVLCAPASPTELVANLDALDAAPPPADWIAHWERYGDLVRGRGAGRFETAWP